MKRNELQEIKRLEPKVLTSRIRKAKDELSSLIMDKNMKKLKDVRAVFKKRKDLAQMLTVLRQRELLVQLESRVETDATDAEQEPRQKGVKTSP